jgi:anhydro-N-acetylmuramic acid kinase
VGLFIGVMSGTSMDAVDCALVDLAPEPPRLLARLSTPWPPTLRERLHAAAAGSPLSATAFGRLDSAVGQFIADAVHRLCHSAGREAAEIDAIGSHGQTVAHAPEGEEPTSVQLGDAHVIAERTGITTVSDFRRRDVASGGQGAPLAPGFHNAVFRSRDEDRVVLNLGGIANITLLPADPGRPVIGFDTGPANCLMDAWARQHLGAPYDDGGRWAASAAPDPLLLARLLDDAYFELPPPKSTGTQYFSRHWLEQRLGDARAAAPETVQATLLSLTISTVAHAILDQAPNCGRVIVCGGGAENSALMAGLQAHVGRPVQTSAALGIDPQWVEPMAFAWLAAQALAGLSGTVDGLTGARGPRVLGVVHPA